jgi:hypothetical protein
VNKEFPPVDTLQKRLEAIESSRKGLSDIKRVDLYLNVTQSDLQDVVVPAIVAAVQGVTDAKITLRPQELIVDATFDRIFEDLGGDPQLDARIVGSARLHTTGFIVGQTLQWTPWGSRVEISRLEIAGKKPATKTLVALLTAVLNAFLANISGAIGAQTLRLDVPLVATLDPKVLIQGSAVESVEGKPIDFSVHLGDGAVLIDADGLHTLGMLTKERVNPTASPKAATPSITEVDQAFDQYLTAFKNALGRALVDDTTAHWSRTSGLVSKPFVAGLLNSGLDSSEDVVEPKAAVAIRAPDFRQEFGGLEIRADQAPNLNCQANAEKVDCNPTGDCNLNKSCDPGWSCPSCGDLDFVCHAQRLGCEIDKGRYKTQCEAEKVTFRTECEARKVIERGACEARKAAELLGCQANQSWLNAWSGAHFANLYGNASFTNVRGVVVIEKVTFNEDLSSMSVALDVGAGSNVVVTFDLRPVDAGHLACPLPFGGQVRFDLNVQPQSFTLPASLSATTPSQTIVTLHFAIPDVEITFKTSAPPGAALITQNPHFLLACYPLAEITTALGLGNVLLKGRLPDPLIQDTFPRTLPGRTIDVVVEQIKITIGARQIALDPAWLSRSIGFQR